MHQQYQLPPRPPFQRKATTRPLDEPISKGRNNKSNGHKKSFSQGSILEDQPAWLDDLLSDSDSNRQGSFHSRSSSDPMAFLYDDLLPKAMIPFYHDDDDGDDESLIIDRSCRVAFESSCVFGPNSPRTRVNLDLPLLVEGCRSHEHGSFGSTNNLNDDPNQGKRHPRQRSRDRKLHYIAELDKRVLVSELQHNVSTLLQQRLVLTVENTQLKQQASELQQQKLFLDDEYQTLSKEAERLKSGLARLSYQNKGPMHAKSSVMNHKASNYSWEMLEWRKLDLG
ncbi:hypothetical protein V2J09_001215 [Rumex salicifolius]